MIVVIAAVWGTVLFGFVTLTTDESVEPVAEQPMPTDVPAEPTAAPTAEAIPPTVTKETMPAAEVATEESVEPTAAPTATALLPTDTPEPAPVETAGVSFAQDILPIFESRCLRCHGSTRTEANLLLNSFNSLMVGSEDGPVVIPGDAAASVLVQVVVSGEMPRRSPQLLPAETQAITDWVNAGAPDN
jgi:hypothetical protein